MRYEIKTLEYDSDLYPNRLRRIADPPKELFYAGDIELLRERTAGIVGSRKYTLYGKLTARMIGGILAKSGIAVVSGLAYGIDAFSHEGTLEAEGKAIAVLGTGINAFSPVSNQKLFDEIYESGLILSEFEPYFKGSRYSFPKRNRIISGISEKIIVVEAGYKSGALITARYASEQGRDVYAVPGNINSMFSLGTNLLIRDGAIPLVVIDDVLRDMGIEVNNNIEEKIELDSEEKLVFNAVKQNDGASVNEISHLINKKVEYVSAILTVLEIKGAVVSYGGKIHLAK